MLSGGNFGTDDDRSKVRALEEDIRQAVESAGVGEFDGDEFGGGKVVLFMYGADADKLFAVVEPILRRDSSYSGHAVLRYGEPGESTRRREVDF
ncbi:hypothetical protein Aglo01_55240 [Actinokineospora globicatena]|nr:hypothetical protein Aglo01_55240 [Actinokineospora globicatena]GLW88236.1 hypothetical protein Aglo02_58750 [Actinokineospora globicatena]